MTLVGFNPEYSYEEVAVALNMTVDEVKRLEKSALRKLKHPKIGKKLSTLLDRR